MYAIRGATTVDSNESEDIREETIALLRAVLSENCLSASDLSAVIFSSTADLTGGYPAAAAREIGFGSVPLFSCQEPQIEGSLQKCIRVMIFVDVKKSASVRHVYLKGARGLREDLYD